MLHGTLTTPTYGTVGHLKVSTSRGQTVHEIWIVYSFKRSTNVNKARSGRGQGRGQEHEAEAEANSHEAKANSHEAKANSSEAKANSHEAKANSSEAKAEAEAKIAVFFQPKFRFWPHFLQINFKNFGSEGLQHEDFISKHP